MPGEREDRRERDGYLRAQAEVCLGPVASSPQKSLFLQPTCGLVISRSCALESNWGRSLEQYGAVICLPPKLNQRALCFGGIVRNGIRLVFWSCGVNLGRLVAAAVATKENEDIGNYSDGVAGTGNAVEADEGAEATTPDAEARPAYGKRALHTSVAAEEARDAPAAAAHGSCSCDHCCNFFAHCMLPYFAALRAACGRAVGVSVIRSCAQNYLHCLVASLPAAVGFARSGGGTLR